MHSNERPCCTYCMSFTIVEPSVVHTEKLESQIVHFYRFFASDDVHHFLERLLPVIEQAKSRSKKDLYYVTFAEHAGESIRQHDVDESVLLASVAQIYAMTGSARRTKQID